MITLNENASVLKDQEEIESSSVTLLEQKESKARKKDERGTGAEGMSDKRHLLISRLFISCCPSKIKELTPRAVAGGQYD
jgi:hypothetical protein